MKQAIILIVLVVLVACKAATVQKIRSSGNQALAADTLARDTLIKFAARPELGFNFEYLVYLPRHMRLHETNYLLVETNNTGLNDTINYHEKGARYAAAKSSVGNYVAKRLHIPLLVPIFPRSATDWTYYTHALDRDVMLTKNRDIERLDLQLLAMVRDAQNQLKRSGINLHEKFFITGFSASGTFANRFSLLHPEVLQATASGGINAIAMLPVSQLNNQALNYPLGIADVQKITGRKVSLKAFQKLPKLLYMGALDDNDAAAFDDAYSDEERTTVYELMGKQMIPARWQFMQEVYQENNVTADFRTYPNIGHGTDQKINNDVADFFQKHSK